MDATVTIVGGGPAGASAALSALRAGARVRLFEKSRFPRHKVCGEFLSPESQKILRELGLGHALRQIEPPVIRRSVLHFHSSAREFTLPEPALGLSRYALDALLLEAAVQQGAELIREQINVALLDTDQDLVILAHGRQAVTSADERGRRLFGFKAHFTGLASNAVELFFFDGCYVGVIPVEQGKTNVCGLGPERVLKRFGFEHDELIASCPALRKRLKHVARTMDWLSVGPLIFGNQFRRNEESEFYSAGDFLSFVDPFTGSGLLAAMKTGILAGEFAALRRPPQDYLKKARQSLESPFLISRFMRFMIERGFAEPLAPWIPGKMLFHLTRPGMG